MAKQKKPGREDRVVLVYVSFCLHVITFMCVLLYSPVKLLWENLKFPFRVTFSANNPSNDTPCYSTALNVNLLKPISH